MARHRLPPAFRASVERCFNPCADWLAKRVLAHRLAQPGTAFVLGINGAQGTGKSTLAAFLAEELATRRDLSAAILSIDDLYLSKLARLALSDTVHPLLKTRGVPGTHDVELGLQTLDALVHLKQGESIALPRFDKGVDDVCPRSQWPLIEGPVDVVLFEGWCVGSLPAPAGESSAALNELEASMDADGRWRAYVNDRLAADYQALFARLDALLFLQAPGFDCVYRWRLEQEHKLRDRVGADASGVMTDAEVARFIAHYERITRRNLATLGEAADAVISLGRDHAALRFSIAEDGRQPVG